MSSQTTRVCKLLAIALSFVLLLQFVTAQGATAFVVSAEESSQSATTTSDGTTPSADIPLDILYEDTSRREANVKHFVMSDHTGKAVVYAEPVHYEVDGKWIDIDNSLDLEDATDADDVNGFANTANSFRIKFANNINSSKLVRIKADNYQLSWGYVSDTKRSASGTVKARTDIEPSTVEEKISAAVANTSSAITYPYVEENMSLQYVVTPTGVKENIIVHSSADTYTYRFEIKAKDVTLVTQEDGSIHVVSDETGEVVFTMPAPYMYDDSGRFSTAVTYTLANVSNNKAELIVTADPEWINSPDTVFPVTIDPIMTVRQTSANIDSAWVGDAASVCNTNQVTALLSVGWDTAGAGHTRTLVKFSLPTLGKSDMLIGANLKMTMWHSSYWGTADRQITAHYITEPWDLSTVTWNNQPAHSWSVCDYNFITALDNNTSEKDVYFDITQTVKQWYTGDLTNYGILIRQPYEPSGEANYPYYGAVCWFRSERYNSENSTFPTVEIDYRNNKGLEDYWSYTTASAGTAGTAYINDYSGNLVFVAPILSSFSEVMPLSLSAVYNGYCSNDLSPAGDDSISQTMIGTGWRLNIQQTLLPSSKIGITDPELLENFPYVYTDGDGTDHYFKKEIENGSVVYRDEDGLGLTLLVSGSYALITDEKDNTLFFDMNGNLTRITTANGHQIRITYHSTLTSRIHYIQDGSGRKFTLYYTGDSYYVNAISDNRGRAVTFTRGSNNTLMRILYPNNSSGQFTYTTSSPYSMTKAISADGGYLQFGYTSSASGLRVQEIREFGSTTESGINPSGRQLVFGRTHHNTTVIRSGGTDNTLGNSDDLLTTYQFDNAGRTISTSLNRATSDEIYANSDYGGTSVRFFETNNIQQENRIQSATAVKKITPNLVTNGNAEGITGWTSYQTSATGSFASTSADKYFGEKSLTITSTAVSAAGGYVAYYQDVTGLIGSMTYVFSAYVKADNLAAAYSDSSTGVWISMTAMNSSSSAYARSVQLTADTNESIDNGWIRLSASVDIPPDCTTVRVHLTIQNMTGTAWFDGMQLEEEQLGRPSPFNMLQNSNFEKVSSGVILNWTPNNFAFGMTGIDAVDNYCNFVQKDGGLSMRFKGNTYADKYLSQTIPVSPEPDDSYIISGWAKAEPGAAKVSEHREDGYGSNVYFEIAIVVNYKKADGSTFSEQKYPARFNPALTNWQYAAQAFSLRSTTVTDATPVSITVCPRYGHQINYAYFDCLQLVRDVAQTYAYDDEGNLVSAIASAEEKSTMEYDGADLTSITDALGYNYEYTYDDNHNLLSATSAGGVVTSITYNAYGQASSAETTSADGALTMRSEIGYTDPSGVYPGAHIAWIEDANGNRTSYTYDSIGRTTSVTNASGTTTTYTYVSNKDDRLASVSSGNTSVSYVYDGEKLSSLTYGADTYQFSYDPYGNVISTSVNDSVLVTNTYRARNGLLDAVEYANGTGLFYSYDYLGNVTSVYGKISLTSTRPLYHWNYNNNNELVTHWDMVSMRRFDYTFDSLGRLVREWISKNGTQLGAVEYGYDQRNNVNRLVVDYGGHTHEQRYVYDAIAGKVKTETYEKENLPIRYMYSDANYIDYSYDGLNRLSSRYITTDYRPIPYYYFYDISDRNEEGQTLYQTNRVKTEIIGLTSYRYTYDITGNIIKIEKGHYTTADWENTFVDYTSYEYDSQGQLVRENSVPDDSVTLYAYDSYGNILSKSRYEGYSEYIEISTQYLIENDVTPNTRTVYGYGSAANGFAKVATSRTQFTFDLSDDSYTFVTSTTSPHDAIGNPLSYLGATLTWTNGRQLATYSKNGLSLSYAYDAVGLRSSKTVNDVVSEYLYVGDQLVYECRDGHDIYYYYDSFGRFAGLRYYLDDNTYEHYYAVTNFRGDVVGLYDVTGYAVASYEYDAWGKLLSITDTTTIGIGTINPFRYRGYYYDTETGWYYLQSRYYDPVTCRFINADSQISGVGGNVFGYNPFLYCFNNPVNMTDSSGCWPQSTKNVAFTVVMAVKKAVEVVAKTVESTQTSFSFANVVAKEHFTTPLLMADMGPAFGKIGFSSTVTKEDKEPGLVHAYSDLGNDAIEYAAGVNIIGCLGANIGVSSELNVFVQAQVTPWIHGRLSGGLDGVGAVIGVDVGDTSYDFEVKAGLVTVVMLVFPEIGPYAQQGGALA